MRAVVAGGGQPAVSLLERSAVFSPDGRYRYRLDRAWGSGPPMVAVWLNPSTADAETDDPTVRRGMGFARAAGCGRLVVVNLFGWRATDPAQLRTAADPVGPDNDAWIAAAAAEPAAVVVAGWGARADPIRVRTVLGLLGDSQLFCLGRTAGGAPRHPLYLPVTASLAGYPAGSC